MTEQQKFSEEFISAFVDNELTPEEKAQAYTQLGNDEALNRQVCELRKVRDLVGLAYANVPKPNRSMIAIAAVGRKYRSNGLAAGLALIVGGLSGWFLHPSSPTPATLVAAQVTPGDEATAKVLFHVSDGSVEHLKYVLDEVESLMKFYRDTNQLARVEVIANGDGLGLLTANVSPYADRIQRMQQEYASLTFVACQNTIERFQRELGLRTVLLPGVIKIDSGVAQLMRRQHQGWAYIQA